MNTYLSIGEMAKLNNVTIQTLRHYDKLDIFKPEYVNKDNNYRYYSVRQIFYLDIIKYLKFIGTPLDQIKQVIELAPEEIYLFLDKQGSIVEEKIMQLQDSHRILNQRKGQLKEQLLLGRQTKGVPYQRRIAERKVLKLQLTNQVTPLDNPDMLFRNLANILEVEGMIIDNLYGCIYPLQDYKQTADIQYSALYTNVHKEAISSMHTDVALTSIPEGRYLCITFKWSIEAYYGYFSKLKEAYMEMGLPMLNDVYEVSLPNNYAVAKDEDFISELQIRIDQ
ncbi:MerR family transcriptional regulator [Paenibacillus sp. SZ31]|uniref:MerR family transcriptional regulator n=1 Tax=unclassified Paenibacillus TaxID=185978 RepID=UPI00146CEB08|nr:MerR family transcriptional regulator [Paenibacillus sp. SZ31]NMI03396.1 MerR family transcriptional regulator [Paenibacillus sp. SZ31]